MIIRHLQAEILAITSNIIHKLRVTDDEKPVYLKLRVTDNEKPVYLKLRVTDNEKPNKNI